MAIYPPRGLLDWDDELKAYIDDSDGMVALRAAVDTELANRYTKTQSDSRYVQPADMTTAITNSKATGLAVGTNLNTVQTSGNYLGFAGTIALNYPIEGYSGTLRVDNFGSGSALQIFTPQSGGNHVLKTQWTRRMISNAWSGWTPLTAPRFVAATTGAEAYLYDPTSTAGVDRQVPVIQTPLGSADLNTITSVGSYIQGTNTLATLALNYPIATVYGILDVQRLNSQNVTQTFTTIASSKAVWRRRLSSNTWEPWEQIPLLRIDNPSSQPGMEVFIRNGDTGADMKVPLIGMDLGVVDLNAVTVPGTYRQGSTTTATLALNYPVAATQGFLEVSRLGNDAANILQKWSVFGGSSSGPKMQFVRRCINSTWGLWESMSTVRWVENANVGRVGYMWNPAANAEQLIYGDTGWRDITALMISTASTPAVDVASGAVRLRRFGPKVFLAFANTAMNNPSATVNRDYNNLLPAGFRPTNTQRQSLTVNQTTFGTITPYNTGLLQLVPGTTAALFNEVSWSTSDAWPTALPGTAQGAIPSA